MAKSISIKLTAAQRRRFLKVVRTTQDVKLKLRYEVILHYDEGYGGTTIAAMLHCAHSTPWRVARRFQWLGEAGLLDGRCDNGCNKVDESCYITLTTLLEHQPPDYGWARPTWTQELFAEELFRQQHVRVSSKTISRMLKHLGARRGGVRPTVACPWSKRRRRKRLRQIHELIETLPPDDVAFWEDEVDIHLNPKAGRDWMLPGQQKTVRTPGNNRKHYLAGALDVRTGAIHYVHGEHKRSTLFVDLLQHLVARHRRAPRIHLILDNFVIHTSRLTTKAIEAFEGRVVLHFLPPYDPNDNRIEHLWLDLHANVTRNHRYPTIDELLQNVYEYLSAASPFPGSKPAMRRAAS